MGFGVGILRLRRFFFECCWWVLMELNKFSLLWINWFLWGVLIFGIKVVWLVLCIVVILLMMFNVLRDMDLFWWFWENIEVLRFLFFGVEVMDFWLVSLLVGIVMCFLFGLIFLMERGCEVGVCSEYCNIRSFCWILWMLLWVLVMMGCFIMGD